MSSRNARRRRVARVRWLDQRDEREKLDSAGNVCGEESCHPKVGVGNDLHVVTGYRATFTDDVAAAGPRRARPKLPLAGEHHRGSPLP